LRLVKKVLYIEDNPADVILMKKAIKINNLAIELHNLTDGEQALDHLKEVKNRNYKNLPDLIISDLNLPKISGKEIIAEIKKDNILKNIPLIVCSTSNTARDIDDCNKLGVNSYHVKSINFDETINLVTLLSNNYLSDK